MLISTFIFVLMKVFVKMIPHIPPIEIILFRSVVSLILSVAILKRQKISVWGNDKMTLLFRGISGAIALSLFFWLLQQVPLAAASTLQYISPIFSAILGIFILKEKMKWYQFVFFALSFGGIFLIQGFDPRVTFEHILIGVTSAFFTGLAYNLVRKLKATEHPLVIIFYFPLVTLPLSLIYTYFDWVTPEGMDWLILLMVGLCTQVAQYFMTRSLQVEEISKVSILNYIGILYSLAFGFLIFGELYNALTYVGMFLVLVGVILNIRYKLKQASPKVV